MAGKLYWSCSAISMEMSATGKKQTFIVIKNPNRKLI
jgi:hypothetical protein